MYIKAAIRDDIKMQHTTFKLGLTAGQRLCMCLFYMASGASQQAVSGSVQFSQNSVSRAVADVTRASPAPTT